MKLQELLEAISRLNNDEFEVILNGVDQQRAKRAQTILAEAQRQASRFSKETSINTKAPRAKRPPKYVNPTDSRETWSGMGRQPEWFKEHLSKGGHEKDLLIK